ncbi:MAG: hypothetical protein OJF49_003317 [Ktedonobacterales bacterium]|jgi:glycogen debranching enzyme|nr:MAG: hypothetical protein OJF49_003317 [Ktedonobacterales bacterium]
MTTRHAERLERKQQHEDKRELKRDSGKHAHRAHISDISGTITVKHNQVFLLLSPTGDIPHGANGEGLYFRDMRYLDHMELQLNEQRPVSLLADAEKGSVAVFELTNPHLVLADGTEIRKQSLSIRRSYTIAQDITQEIEVRNLEREAVSFPLRMLFGSQFDDMMVVRSFVREPVQRGRLHTSHAHGDMLTLGYNGADGHARATQIRFTPAPESLHGGVADYTVTLPPHARQTITLTLELSDEVRHEAHSPVGMQTMTTGIEQHSEFDQILAQLPEIETSNALFDRALRRSFDDVRMLITVDRQDAYVAAGIPWYVALFGRDSCITAFETLAFQPALARSTLRVLAHYQGTRHNAYEDEEPGKILHELRVGETANLHEIPMTPYYGSVDSTMWFLMLLEQYVRWTGDVGLFVELRENVERALDWMDHNEKTSTLNGFFTYGTKSERGFVNQGWKDSDNAIVNTDGSLVQPPVALVEVQGYAYRTWHRIAGLLRDLGEAQRAAPLEQRAEALKRRFNDAYWMEEQRYYALAIERGGKRSEAIASNAGHTLFTGIVPDERAKAIAERLLESDMFCGWGIRTLAETEAAYNPLDYQVGSVWPHDNALIALGLRHWGFAEQMERVFTGIFQAATHFPHFRLPEVFDGFSRDQYRRPVTYPVACSPQAWAAGALPLLLQSALGLEPHALFKTLHITRPHLPEWLTTVTVRGLHVGQARVDLRYLREMATTHVAVLRREGDVVVTVEY